MTLSLQKTPLFKKSCFMTPFFTLFVLSRASDNTTSQNVGGGTDAWAVPPPQIWGGGVPPVPLGLRSALHSSPSLRRSPPSPPLPPSPPSSSLLNGMCLRPCSCSSCECACMFMYVWARVCVRVCMLGMEWRMWCFLPTANREMMKRLFHG